MFTTLETFDTKYSADSVEWCPIEGFQDLFVCGTYQLTHEEQQSASKTNIKSQKRLGRIFLFQVIIPGTLKLLYQINVPAVLDIKWAHVKCNENILLGIVNSLGYLQIYKLIVDDGKRIELLLEKKIRQVEDEVLALSLDWSTGKSPSDGVQEAKITVSDSKGCVSLFYLNQDNLTLNAFQKAHDFEAWITCFDYWDTNVIYTGSDDCKFRRFDLRSGLQSTGTNKSHGAGITSLHSNISEEFCLASGSYDEILRLWDMRNFRCPVAQTNLGGGIWRLKWDPFHYRYLLAACMYGGFRVVDCEKKENPEVIGEYNEHNSIAYGCDWSFLLFAGGKLCQTECQKSVFAATCSFYDNTLKLSSISFGE